MSGIRYRADIDGLRALAILPVVLYHAGLPMLDGGFVGVDVFFVISGFLITSLIVKDLQAGQFSLADFWRRRVRRIMPALSVVILTTLIAGWFLLLPKDYDMLGQQVAAQGVFSSNILFFANTGYFADKAYLRVLLHTWSLAVEEQFYIFFPVVMFALWRYARRAVVPILVAVTVLSCIACIIGTNWNKDMAFFLLPFRGWELLIGSLTVFVIPKTAQVDARLRGAAGLAGLLLIAAAILLFTEEMRFPGWAAAVPCLGAALFIWANAAGLTLSGRVMSWRPLVWIGLVSYSWYLWHWPLMSFFRYFANGELTFMTATICVLGSLALVILTWHFVERPFRRPDFFVKGNRNALLAGAAVLSVFLGTGLFIHAKDGVPSRLDPAVVAYAMESTNRNPREKECTGKSAKDIHAGKLCTFVRDGNAAPSFILWGGSHADALVPLLEDLSRAHNENGYIATYHGCSPLYHHKREGMENKNCEAFNDAVIDFIQTRKIKHVFFVSNWSSWLVRRKIYFDDKSWYAPYREKFPDIRMASFMKMIDVLQESGAKVYLMNDLPEASFDPPRGLALERLRGRDETRLAIPRAEYDAVRKVSSDDFLVRADDPAIAVIDPALKLCNENTCMIQDGGHSLYSNDTHLSLRGTMYLRDLFEPYFQKGFK